MCLLKTCHIKHDVFWLSAFRYDNVFIGLNLEFMTSPFNIVQANLTVHRLVRFYTFFFILNIVPVHSQWLTSVTIYGLLTTGS